MVWATTLFGFSTLFALSYFLFAMTGVADTVSTVIRNVIRQINTPDHLRGRVTSVNMVFFMGGPPTWRFGGGAGGGLPGRAICDHQWRPSYNFTDRRDCLGVSAIAKLYQ